MKYTRTPEHDRRIQRGDDFAGDAWLDNETGRIEYACVGYDRNKLDADEAERDFAHQEALEELRAFRDIGHRFVYVGIEMLVESHFDVSWSVGGPIFTPMITAAYRDNNGVLRHARFSRHDLVALRAENQD